jgi:hypothetical protein
LHNTWSKLTMFIVMNVGGKTTFSFSVNSLVLILNHSSLFQKLKANESNTLITFGLALFHYIF